MKYSTVFDKILEEIEACIRKCDDSLAKCHPRDQEAFINKIQAYVQAIQIIKRYGRRKDPRIEWLISLSKDFKKTHKAAGVQPFIDWAVTKYQRPVINAVMEVKDTSE